MSSKYGWTKIKTQKLLLIIFILNLISCQQAISSEPENVVKVYCELDFNGARVFNNRYQDIVELMNWEEGQDEPGWDCFYIISEYKLGEQQITSKSARVKVNYSILGELCSDFVLDKKNIIKVASFELEMINNKWNIKDYVSPPMISLKYVKSYFEKEIEGIKKKEEIKKNDIYEQLILDLKKLEDAIK